jgi:hypothetical protein
MNKWKKDDDSVDEIQLIKRVRRTLDIERGTLRKNPIDLTALGGFLGGDFAEEV